MGESNIIELLLKSKIARCALILLGLTLFLTGLSDYSYYIVNYGSSFNESALETAIWLTRDTIAVITGIVIWIVSVKIMRAKCC